MYLQAQRFVHALVDHPELERLIYTVHSNVVACRLELFDGGLYDVVANWDDTEWWHILRNAEEMERLYIRCDQKEELVFEPVVIVLALCDDLRMAPTAGQMGRVVQDVMVVAYLVEGAMTLERRLIPDLYLVVREKDFYQY
jgi:hypothetical protein